MKYARGFFIEASHYPRATVVPAGVRGEETYPSTKQGFKYLGFKYLGFKYLIIQILQKT